MTAQLVTDALMMAIWRRGKPDALLHHSDRGSQYTSEQFQRLMTDHGVTELLLVVEDRAHGAQNVQDSGRSQGGRVRLHRALLQSQAQALDDRLSEPYGVRDEEWISLSECHPNRGQLKDRARGRKRRNRTKKRRQSARCGA